MNSLVESLMNYPHENETAHAHANARICPPPHSPHSPALSAADSLLDNDRLATGSHPGITEAFFEKIEWDPSCRLYSAVGPKDQSQSVLTNLVLKPKVEKGFFYREGKWTCFRRNHFQIAVDMEFDFPSASKNLHIIEGDAKINLRQFYVTIHAHGSLSFSQLKIYQASTASSHTDLTPIDFSPEPKTKVTFRRLQFNQSTPLNPNRQYVDRYFSISIQVHCVGDDGIVRKLAECHSTKLVVLSGTPGQYKAKEAKGNSPLKGGKPTMKREVRAYRLPSRRSTSSAPPNDYIMESISHTYAPSHKPSHSFDYSDPFYPNHPSYHHSPSPSLLFSSEGEGNMSQASPSYDWSSGAPDSNPLFSPPEVSQSPLFVQSYPVTTTPQPDLNAFFDFYKSTTPSFLVSPDSLQRYQTDSPIMSTESTPQLANEEQWVREFEGDGSTANMDSKIQNFFLDFNQ